MAAPITHILQTEIIYKKYFSNKSKRDYFIGTCFPDIRLTGVIEEEKTHFENLSFDDLKNASPFWAGIKLHSIVDNFRKDFIAENKIYDNLPKVDYIKESLKLFEDEYYFDLIDDLPAYIEILREISPEELEFGIQEKDIKNWHNIIINYLSKKPDDNSRMKYHLDMGFSADSVNTINKNIIALRTDENAIKSCKDFNNYILNRIERELYGK